MGRIKDRVLAADEAGRRRAALGDLIPYGADIFCWCNRCGHNAVLPLGTMLARFGPAQEAPALGAPALQRLRVDGRRHAPRLAVARPSRPA